MKRTKIRVSGLLIVGMAAACILPTRAEAKDCTFPNGDKTKLGEMVSNIKDMKGDCALP